MDKAERYITDAIPGFDVWRDDDADLWRGRHQESGRTISAQNWEELIWRAYEVRVFLTIANMRAVIDGLS